MNDHYVYVYIDPRNFEEFYYGKGIGSRKEAHLSDSSDSEKARRIAEIKKEGGLVPIIRVIAAGLTAEEAFLVEKTLLWKLGRTLTNVSSGQFADKFRPHNTLHLELPGFDYQKGLYYYNVGEGPHRNWDDYVKFGFIAAGHGKRWRDGMLGFQVGDVVVAYLKGRGFVGVGEVTQRAKRFRDVVIGGKNLLELGLKCRDMGENSDDPDLSEYVALVRWIKWVGKKDEAKWKAKAGLYTTRILKASLASQPATISFVEKEFQVDLRDWVR